MSNCIPLNLEWFSKNDGSWEGEEMICIEANLILNILGIKTKDYTVFANPQEINEQNGKIIQNYFCSKIDTDKYNYYLYLYGDYECRDGIPVEVPYDPSRFRQQSNSEDGP